MESCLVSVIIPTYKGAEKLARAIDSVISQTYGSVEVIVVDDNEPLSAERKQTEDVISNKKYSHVKYFKHECNKNGAAARNTGIRHAKGKYVCFLDDDDFYLPGRIEKSVALLEADNSYDSVYCGVILADKHRVRNIIKAEKVLVQRDILMNEMTIGTGSNLFITRKALEKLGGFDEKFYRHQDIEFMVRVLEEVKVINLNEELIVKATNSTSNIPEYEKLIAVKELFFEKFFQQIDRLEERDKQEFFCYHYSLLLYSAFKSKNKANIKEAVTNIKKYRPLTKNEKIEAVVTANGFLNKLYRNTLKVYLHFRAKPAYSHSKQVEFKFKDGVEEYILGVLSRN